ncbi:hypothetical protein BJF78_02355 [Pseudonocardia sp. CNS-139]|nr:hypothetical protein BJF78_02355 [Pseudonocardia sp. CNS-139]
MNAVSVLAPGLRRTTAGVVLAVSLVAFEQLAVVTVAPAAAADVGGSALYGWLFTAFLLAQVLGAAAAGRLADRRGVTLPLRLALAVAAAGLAVAAAAPDVATLLAGRVLQGVGGGALVTGVYATISTAYPPALRPRMLSVFGSAFVVPALAGPAVAVAVASVWGWRAVFLLMLPLVAAAAGCLAGGARERPDAAPGRPASLLAAAALAAGTGALVAGRAAGARRAAGRGRGGAGRGRGAAAGAASRRAAARARAACRRRREGPARGRVLRDAGAPRPPARARRGRRRAGRGRVTFPAAAFLHERLDARAGGRGRTVRGAVGAALVALGAAGVAAGTGPLWPGLAWTAASAGMGVANAAAATAAFTLAPPGGTGRVSAAVLLAELVGPAAAIGVTGALLAAGAAAFTVPVALAVLATVAAARTGP